MYCVVKVTLLRSIGSIGRKWECTDSDCSNCDGLHCSDYTLTVSTEGEVSDLSPVSDCRYGDTVILERGGRIDFDVYELRFQGKQGKLNKPVITINVTNVL